MSRYLVVWILLFLDLCICCLVANHQRRQHGIEQIPYITYLEFNNHHVMERDYHAAGIIIDRNMVLTRAYHCEVGSSSSFRVYPGQTYVNPKLLEFRVSKYVLHPARARKTYDETKSTRGYHLLYTMDFCLLRLAGQLTLGSAIQMASLPLPLEPLDPQQPLMVSGWGPYRDMNYKQGQLAGDGYANASLYYHITVPESTKECQEAVKGFDIKLSSDLFCLGYHCKDFHTAQGDDGAPIVNPKTQIVVGMVVNYRPFDALEKPQINAKICHAVGWINKIRKMWKIHD